MPRKPSNQDQDYFRRLEAQRNKTLPPGSRWHQYWCAIFRRKPCDCDGPPPRPPRRLRRGGGGAAAASMKQELEDA